MMPNLHAIAERIVAHAEAGDAIDMVRLKQEIVAALRAVQAETREACAKVAEECAITGKLAEAEKAGQPWWHIWGVNAAREEIAAAIRAGASDA